jgi:renalase
VTKATIAIIGAGMAGLACARVLAQAGHDVRMFDKGRGPGGRMSTRRATTSAGEVQFDHGAQYFTARDPAFVSVVKELLDTQAAAQWQGNLVRMAETNSRKPLAQEALYVGVPGMNGVVRALALDLDVAWGVRVETLSRADNIWHVTSEQGESLGVFDQIVCAIPAEQVVPLLADHAPRLADAALKITSLPCQTGMFAFDTPLELGFDALRLDSHPMIDFIAANHSKPGRQSQPSAYVVQAHGDWSRAHLEEPAEQIAAALLEGLLSFCDNRPNVLLAGAHRWRYAKVEVQLGIGCDYDEEAAIGVCGDWLSGPRVESAWTSGHALGRAMVRHLKSA